MAKKHKKSKKNNKKQRKPSGAVVPGTAVDSSGSASAAPTPDVTSESIVTSPDQSVSEDTTVASENTESPQEVQQDESLAVAVEEFEKIPEAPIPKQESEVDESPKAAEPVEVVTPATSFPATETAPAPDTTAELSAETIAVPVAVETEVISAEDGGAKIELGAVPAVPAETPLTSKGPGSAALAADVIDVEKLPEEPIPQEEPAAAIASPIPEEPIPQEEPAAAIASPVREDPIQEEPVAVEDDILRNEDGSATVELGAVLAVPAEAEKMPWDDEETTESLPWEQPVSTATDVPATSAPVSVKPAHPTIFEQAASQATEIDHGLGLEAPSREPKAPLVSKPADAPLPQVPTESALPWENSPEKTQGQPQEQQQMPWDTDAAEGDGDSSFLQNLESEVQKSAPAAQAPAAQAPAEQAPVAPLSPSRQTSLPSGTEHAASIDEKLSFLDEDEDILLDDIMDDELLEDDAAVQTPAAAAPVVAAAPVLAPSQTQPAPAQKYAPANVNQYAPPAAAVASASANAFRPNQRLSFSASTVPRAISPVGSVGSIKQQLQEQGSSKHKQLVQKLETEKHRSDAYDFPDDLLSKFQQPTLRAKSPQQSIYTRVETLKQKIQPQPSTPGAPPQSQQSAQSLPTQQLPQQPPQQAAPPRANPYAPKVQHVPPTASAPTGPPAPPIPPSPRGPNFVQPNIPTATTAIPHAPAHKDAFFAELPVSSNVSTVSSARNPYGQVSNTPSIASDSIKGGNAYGARNQYAPQQPQPQQPYPQQSQPPQSQLNLPPNATTPTSPVGRKSNPYAPAEVGGHARTLSTASNPRNINARVVPVPRRTSVSEAPGQQTTPMRGASGSSANGANRFGSPHVQMQGAPGYQPGMQPGSMGMPPNMQQSYGQHPVPGYGPGNAYNPQQQLNQQQYPVPQMSQMGANARTHRPTVSIDAVYGDQQTSASSSSSRRPRSKSNKMLPPMSPNGQRKMSAFPTPALSGPAPVVLNPENLVRRQWPLFSFSASGKTASMIPNSDGYGGRIMNINVEPLTNYYHEDQLSTKFPGPLTKGKSRRKDLEKWLNEKIASTGAGDPTFACTTASDMLWRILHVICTDVLKPGDITSKEYYEKVVGALNPGSKVANAHQQQMDLMALSRAANNGGASSKPFNAHEIDQQGITRIYSLLEGGQTETALEYCISEDDWALAFTIAGMMGPAATSEVVKLYTLKRFRGDDTTDQMMSFFVNASAGGTGFTSNPSWLVENFASVAQFILLSTAQPGQTMAQMAVSLFNSGHLEHAMVCYVLAGQFATPPVFPIDIESALALEAFEFLLIDSQNVSVNIGSAGFGWMLPIKTNHGGYLADLGAVTEAKKYADAVESAMASKQLPYGPAEVLNQKHLSERLAQTSGSGQGWLGGKLKVWDHLDKSFNKFVAGEELPAESTKPKSEVFSNFSSPVPSRSASRLDLNNLSNNVQTPPLGSHPSTAQFSPYSPINSTGVVTPNFNSAASYAIGGPAPVRSADAGPYAPPHQRTSRKPSVYTPTALSPVTSKATLAGAGSGTGTGQNFPLPSKSPYDPHGSYGHSMQHPQRAQLQQAKSSPALQQIKSSPSLSHGSIASHQPPPAIPAATSARMHSPPVAAPPRLNSPPPRVSSPPVAAPPRVASPPVAAPPRMHSPPVSTSPVPTAPVTSAPPKPHVANTLPPKPTRPEVKAEPVAPPPPRPASKVASPVRSPAVVAPTPYAIHNPETLDSMVAESTRDEIDIARPHSPLKAHSPPPQMPVDPVEELASELVTEEPTAASDILSRERTLEHKVDASAEKEAQEATDSNEPVPELEQKSDVKPETPSEPAQKPEEPKVEEPNAEEPKKEEAKPEEPKPEELKVEEPKVEEPKVEEPKVEEPNVEEPKVEEPKKEEAKPEEKPESKSPEVAPKQRNVTSPANPYAPRKTHASRKPTNPYANMYQPRSVSSAPVNSPYAPAATSTTSPASPAKESAPVDTQESSQLNDMGIPTDMGEYDMYSFGGYNVPPPGTNAPEPVQQDAIQEEPEKLEPVRDILGEFDGGNETVQFRGSMYGDNNNDDNEGVPAPLLNPGVRLRNMFSPPHSPVSRMSSRLSSVSGNETVNSDVRKSAMFTITEAKKVYANDADEEEYMDDIIDEDDDEDDDAAALAAAAAAAQKRLQEEEQKKKEAEEKERQESKKAGNEKKVRKRKSGWFDWMGKGGDDSPKPIKAKMGEENHFVYDPELKRWINKDKPLEEQIQATPPPPPPGKKAGGSRPSATAPPSRVTSQAGAPPPRAVSGAPPAMGSSSTKKSDNLDDLLGLAGGPGGPRPSRSRRGPRRGYVDVMSQQK